MSGLSIRNDHHDAALTFSSSVPDKRGRKMMKQSGDCVPSQKWVPAELSYVLNKWHACETRGFLRCQSLKCTPQRVSLHPLIFFNSSKKWGHRTFLGSLYDHQQAKKQQCCQVEKLLLGGAVLKILSVVRVSTLGQKSSFYPEITKNSMF